jgi:hypothetical protein
MSQNFPTDAGVLITPGAYARYNVVQQNTGIATTGIIMLVGEADAGPDFTQEADLASTVFGPGQIGDVKAKYKTGRLVDAFNSGAVPANDPQIQGAPAGFILVKTNPSRKASAVLSNFGNTAYATLQDRSWGKAGNQISYEVTAKTAESGPTTGSFAFALAIATTDISVRVNGGATQTLTIAAAETPTTFASALGGLTGVDTSGGAAIAMLTGTTGTIAATVITGKKVQFDRSVAWDHLPAVGDTLYVASTAGIAVVSATNGGSYIVYAVPTDKQILAEKVLDITGTPGQNTTPLGATATAIVGTSDVVGYGAITATLIETLDPIDGYGKNLQINELETGTDLLSALCHVNGTSGAEVVDWISNDEAPHLIVSDAEYVATLTEARASDNVTNDITAGGAIALKLGYLGTTATATIDGTSITLTVAGGDSASLSPIVVTLADWPAIADLAAYINSLGGFTCAAGSAVLGSQPSTALDQGVFGICSTFDGLTPGRIKMDAYKFFTSVRDNAFLTELAAQATSGLPQPTTGVSFLSGGAKGATSDANIAAAFDALKMVRGNFLVPLFSRDATADVADGLTETASAYTIEAVNSNARAHVLQMSTLKKRRNRQAFLSFRGALTDVKSASGELASFRCSLAFQDVRDRSVAGSVAQFQPWMNAVKAAGMQAAGFYRAIFNKGIAISGALQAAGDFNDQDDDAVELALEAGLLIVARPPTGGFKYVSDQTTYGRDNNFVYNSIQAVYVADIISLTTAQIMEQAFVGQSLADVSAAQALSVLDAIMDNMRRLKLIAFSDDAPKGYKNPIIKINGPAMVVSAEVKAATALYFIPITFSITQIQQSA